MATRKTSWKPWGDHPVIVAILVLTAIIGVIISFSSINQKQSVEYVGRVLDVITQSPIHSAKVTLDFSGAPPVVFTDSEGVFRFSLSTVTGSISGRIRVDANGYSNYDRNINLESNTHNLEDIRLSPNIGLIASSQPTSAVSEQPTATAATLSDPASLIRIQRNKCGIDFHLVPDNIRPEDNSQDSLQQLYAAMANGNINGWPAVPVPSAVLSTRPKDMAGDWNFRLDMFSTVEGKQWLRLGNKVTTSFQVQKDVPDHQNIVLAVGQCAGGDERDFPVVTLEGGVDAFSSSSTFPGFDYFSLQPGEFENFNLSYKCSEPGLAYLINVDIPYQYGEETGNFKWSEPLLISCPKTFTVWEIANMGSNDNPQFSLFRNETFVWNGNGYDKK